MIAALLGNEYLFNKHKSVHQPIDDCNVIELLHEWKGRVFIFEGNIGSNRSETANEFIKSLNDVETQVKIKIIRSPYNESEIISKVFQCILLYEVGTLSSENVPIFILFSFPLLPGA